MQSSPQKKVLGLAKKGIANQAVEHLSFEAAASLEMKERGLDTV